MNENLANEWMMILLDYCAARYLSQNLLGPLGASTVNSAYVESIGNKEKFWLKRKFDLCGVKKGK